MEESLIAIKVEANPDIRLKEVTVALERLSDATILHYTRKSVTPHSQSDNEVEANPDIRLKGVTVALERLSDATILHYTRKSVITKSQSDKEDRKKLIERFCPFCNETALGEKSYKRSLKKFCEKCGTDLSYRCLKCKNEYKIYSSICRHIQSKCGSVTRYSCSHCDYVTTYKAKIQMHTFRMHSVTNTIVECKQCGGKFKHIYSLKKHLLYCGKAPDLFCNFCDFKTVHKYKLKAHLQRHSSDESRSSSQTDKSITNNSKYAHLIIRHCKHCDEIIASSVFRGKHICPKCKSKLSLQCVKCGFESNIYSRVYYHIQDKCGARESKCPRCDTILPSHIKLQAHLRNCGTEFSCKLCLFKTTSKYTLNNHVKQHVNRTDKLSNQETENKRNDEANRSAIVFRRNCFKWPTNGTLEDTIANENAMPIPGLDLGIIKIEKDASWGDYIDTSPETQFEAVSDFPVVKQETFIKEELMLSMSECSDDEGGDEFVPLKRKYPDFDDQLVPNVLKKLKME